MSPTVFWYSHRKGLLEAGREMWQENNGILVQFLIHHLLIHDLSLSIKPLGLILLISAVLGNEGDICDRLSLKAYLT